MAIGNFRPSRTNRPYVVAYESMARWSSTTSSKPPAISTPLPAANSHPGGTIICAPAVPPA